MKKENKTLKGNVEMKRHNNTICWSCYGRSKNKNKRKTSETSGQKDIGLTVISLVPGKL